MKRIVCAALLAAAQLALPHIASAQGALPWSNAVSVPLLASQFGNALFYVASYQWTGTHTEYDMARQAADAYLAAHPQTPVYVVLNPSATQTCDAIALPTVPRGDGTYATVSIIGWGSNLSSLVKRGGCPMATTVNHPDSPNGLVTSALFQGFSVSANHYDTAACGFYGMSSSTFFDLSCGNAAPGSDHELEFGNADPNNAGQIYGASLYNLKTFDSVGSGRGAVLTPVWSGTSLTGVTVVNAGTKKYTRQYVRASIVGPDLASCKTVPTLSINVSSDASGQYSNIPTVTYGTVAGATITNAGSCSSTAGLKILIQDGITPTFGMKFTNVRRSNAWNLEATGSNTYGEGWMPASSKNTIIGEHPYTNQTVQIAEYATTDLHINAFFDSPGQYGAAVYGPYGNFVNSVFAWDANTYTASAGYYLGAAAGKYQGWTLSNSQCTNSTTSFVTVTTPQGPLAAGNAAPSGVTLNDLERCDGSVAIDWPTQVTTP